MSRAFVKEDKEQHWLHEVENTVMALETYLTRENQGMRVFQKQVTVDERTGKEMYKMSNGLDYSKDKEGRWYVV